MPTNPRVSDHGRNWSQNCRVSHDARYRTQRRIEIYIASAESGTGKSTIALGLVHLLAASPARVGVFKPIVGSGDETDYLLDLLLEHTTVQSRRLWPGPGRDL